jgi:hypothetical protein
MAEALSLVSITLNACGYIAVALSVPSAADLYRAGVPLLFKGFFLVDSKENYALKQSVGAICFVLSAGAALETGGILPLVVVLVGAANMIMTEVNHDKALRAKQIADAQAALKQYGVLDGYWQRPDGLIVLIKGNVGTFYQLGSTWEEVSNIVKVGDLKFNNIIFAKYNTWNCNELWYKLGGIYSTTEIRWSARCTLVLSSDGNSLTATSASPWDNTDIRSEIYSRINPKLGKMISIDKNRVGKNKNFVGK